ncbi:MAG: translation elongation factor 4 [bacterium]|nr:translation elongation factor 4 [bacterium]
MDNIRNFCIVAHIDHGKSTLADRFLELTKTVSIEKMRPQFLDMMDLEREKGITIKMQPVRMEYILNNKLYILNLIDTPGHVDFSYEVSRSLAAVEGAILLVDATKGIQAQTIANLELAQKQNLVIIPTINKIDSAQARIESARTELADLLKIPENDIFLISGKMGTNIEELLKVVIEKVPKPSGSFDKPFRALIFDSKYDPFKGIIAYVRVVDGEIGAGEKIYLIQTKSSGEVKDLGYFRPQMEKAGQLKEGEIGWLATGIKEPGKVMIGDTIINYQFSPQKSGIQTKLEVLPGYQAPKPMVFLSIYPENPNDFDVLKDGLEKLRLTDAALSFKLEHKEALGRGFQCGFLGLLHAEIITERLRREFNLDLVLSTPSVVYKVITEDDKEIFIYTPSEWPDPSKIKESQELWARLKVLAEIKYLGNVQELLKNIESVYIEREHLGIEKFELVYEVPLREIINKNFYDQLKSVSQGFASMNYEILDWRKSRLQKLDILIAGQKEEALSRIVSEKEAQKAARRTVEKLKENLPSQLYAVAIQAAVGGTIIARETISAKRKDVIAPLYGGDYSRKRKLLERQKKGKKELKEKGRVRIPPKVFLELFRD